jgi:hypothetical protein
MSQFMDDRIEELGWKQYPTWEDKTFDIFRWMDAANSEIKRLQQQVNQLSEIINNIEGRLIEGGTL